MRYHLLFLLREGAGGLRRGIFHSFTAAAALTLAVAVAGLFYYGGVNLQAAASSLLQRFQLEAYVALSLPDDQHDALRRALLSENPGWTIAYISRAQAAEYFAAEFDPTVFEVLRDNPLPASFRLTPPPGAFHADSIRAAARRLSATPGIEEVIYDEDLLALLHQGADRLAQWGWRLGGVAALLALGLTYNAVRLKIDHQRDAIRLMALLGATPGMLRGAYWVQGALLGALGGFAASALLTALALLLRSRLVPGWQPELPGAFAPVIGGAVLGTLGSALAVGKYLRVRG